MPGITGKFGLGVQNEAGQIEFALRVLPRECTGHSKHPLPGITGKFGLGVQNEAGQIEFALRVLPRECTGHSKHPLPTTQEKTLHMDITRWSISKSD